MFIKQSDKKASVIKELRLESRVGKTATKVVTNVLVLLAVKHNWNLQKNSSSAVLIRSVMVVAVKTISQSSLGNNTQFAFSSKL